MQYFFKKEQILNISQGFLMSKTLLVCLVFLLLIKIIIVGGFIGLPNIFFADITKIILTNLVNQEREVMGLNSLVKSEKLDRAAYLKAENMIQNNYFNHVSPTGLTPWFWFSQVGYDYKYAGENLAIGFFDSKDVFQAWLSSPSHKSNLLNPNYNEIGTAVLPGYGENNAIVVVQLFGRQKTQTIGSSVAEEVKTVFNLSREQESKVIQNINETPEEQKLEENNEAINPTEVLINKTFVLEDQFVLSASDIKISPNIYSKIINYMLYSYEELIKGFSYGFSFILIGSLILLIASGKNDINRNLVFRSFIVVALIIALNLIDKEVINLISDPYIFI
jgi:hypothetical protein